MQKTNACFICIIDVDIEMLLFALRYHSFTFKHNKPDAMYIVPVWAVAATLKHKQVASELSGWTDWPLGKSPLRTVCLNANKLDINLILGCKNVWMPSAVSSQVFLGRVRSCLPWCSPLVTWTYSPPSSRFTTPRWRWNTHTSLLILISCSIVFQPLNTQC